MNKHYACSDLHGMWNLWEQIKNFCDETDTIFFLGDAADRGPDGVKIIKDLLEDKRVIYIKGNHEDMLVKSFWDPDWREYTKTWKSNGGNRTLKELKYKSTQQERMNILRALNDLPTYTMYQNRQGLNIILCHAGFSPTGKETEIDEWSLLWDRKHMSDKEWDGNENTFIIHGHTPVQCLQINGQQNVDLKPVAYCGYHKIDIDLGSFTSNTAALLDLDDNFKHYIFAATPSNATRNER